MTAASQYTSEQVLTALKAALEAEDMPAVADLMKLLAAVDPDATALLHAGIRAHQAGDL